MREVAEKVYGTLCQRGPQTIAGLLEVLPVQAGLEELVAYVRVAKAVNAATLERSEQVVIADRSGAQLRANVPALLLSAELFPENLDELVL